MKIYQCKQTDSDNWKDWGEVRIFDGTLKKVSPLNPRLDIIAHSPTGFSWGYAGSGPHQLALAILCDYFKDVKLPPLPEGASPLVEHDSDYFAKKYYHELVRDVISGRDQNEPFSLSEAEIEAWLRRRQENGNNSRYR